MSEENGSGETERRLAIEPPMVSPDVFGPYVEPPDPYEAEACCQVLPEPITIDVTGRIVDERD